MAHWKIKVGKFFFKLRSFTPIPVIILIIILFKPVDFKRFNTLVNIIGLGISVCGSLIRIMAVGFAHAGTSGRESFFRADDLNITGVYSIVRNPIYWGNLFIFTGLLTTFSNFFVLIIGVLLFGIQYYFIIQAEEDFLRKKFGLLYKNYCQSVSSFKPTWRNYKKPLGRFQPKRIIFKENDSLFNLFFFYLVLISYKDYVFLHRLRYPFIYIAGGVVLIVGYTLIKVVKRKKFRYF